jgi:hypothetical protein
LDALNEQHVLVPGQGRSTARSAHGAHPFQIGVSGAGDQQSIFSGHGQGFKTLFLLHGFEKIIERDMFFFTAVVASFGFCHTGNHGAH